MKAKIIAVAFTLLATSGAFAASKWANCGSGPQTEPIQEVFWKSDVDGGHGPDYNLKSGQVLSNSGALCRGGEVLKTNDWIVELKKGLNPAKSVAAFKEVRTAEEFQKFLQANAIAVDDQEKLTDAVTAYLQSKPLPIESPSAMPGAASNPTILVGSSKEDAVILLASSDGKNQNATLMRIKLK